MAPGHEIAFRSSTSAFSVVSLASPPGPEIFVPTVESFVAKSMMLERLDCIVDESDAGRNGRAFLNWSAADWRLEATDWRSPSIVSIAETGLVAKLTLTVPAGVPACVSVLPSPEVKFFELSTVSGFATRSRVVKSSVSPALPVIFTLPKASPRMNVLPVPVSVICIWPE